MSAINEHNLSLVRMNKSNSLTSVYVFPPGGGVSLPYIGLAKGLEDIATFYGIQCPDIFSNIQHRSLINLVATYVGGLENTHSEGAYIFLGWSYGAALAYEVAACLQKKGRDIAYLGLLDFPPVFKSVNEYDTQSWLIFAKKAFGSDVEINWNTLENLSETQAVSVIAEQLVDNKYVIPFGDSHRFVQYKINEVRWFSDYHAQESDLDLDIFVTHQPPEQEKMKIKHGISSLPYHIQWSHYSSGKIHKLDAKGSHMEMLKKPYLSTLVGQLRDRMALALHSRSLL